eukprot:scaffold2458_cov121-Isochrysis_galbana.AAC.4
MRPSAAESTHRTRKPRRDGSPSTCTRSAGLDAQELTERGGRRRADPTANPTGSIVACHFGWRGGAARRCLAREVALHTVRFTAGAPSPNHARRERKER